MGKLSQGTTEAIVFVIIFRFLDHVPPNDLCAAVLVVRFVGDKVDLPQELTLMVLEFTNHLEVGEDFDKTQLATARCQKTSFV